MLHRPTLMPASMRSALKSTPITRSSDTQTNTKPASPIFTNFADDDEIVVVEPTDPDEDRLKQEIVAISPPPPVMPENSQPPSNNGNNVQVGEARITVRTEHPKTIGVIPLNEALQSILACTARNPGPSVSVQPIISAKISPTANILNPYVVSNPLGTLWLHSPLPNASINISTVTQPDVNTNVNQTTQPINPLVAAVLVNCATVNMISQLAGTLGNAAVGNTVDINNIINNSVVTNNNGNSIIFPHTVTGPILPSLLSAISLPTTTTTITLSNGNIPVTSVSVDKTDPPAITNVQANNHRAKRSLSRSVRVKRFKCPVPDCEMAFYSRFNQTEHIRTHTGERPFKCPELHCNAAFKRRRDLRDHWNMHLLDRPSSGLSPEKDFEKAVKEASERLQENIKPEESETNKQLSDKTPGTSNSDNGIVLPLPSGKPVCHIGRFHCIFPGCGKSYARRHRLNEHLATHTGTGPIRCDAPHCPVRYFSQEALECHKLIHQYSSNQGPRRRHTCPYPDCDKAYSKFNKLKEHLRSHTGERPYVCRESGCGAAFIRSYGLKRHELTHVFGRKRVRRLTRYPTTLEKIINGTASEQDMSPVQTIPNHNSNSTLQPKPLESDTKIDLSLPVGNSNSESSTGTLITRPLPTIAPKTMEMSLRPISPIRGTPGMRRPHVCPFKDCGKAFPKLNKLREHICRHTGERPFSCEKCKASFVRMYDLRRHNNIHLRALEPRVSCRPLAPRMSPDLVPGTEKVDKVDQTDESGQIILKPEIP